MEKAVEKGDGGVVWLTRGQTSGGGETKQDSGSTEDSGNSMVPSGPDNKDTSIRCVS